MFTPLMKNTCLLCEQEVKCSPLFMKNTLFFEQEELQPDVSESNVHPFYEEDTLL